MHRCALLTAVVVAALAAALAFAGTATDPNDVRGKLDLRRMVAARDGQLLRMRIGTYEGWRSRVLKGTGFRAGKNKLTVLYDVDLDRRADYFGRIVYASGRLMLWITGKGSAFEPVPVKRPSRSNVSFRHPVSVFFPGPPAGPRRLFIAVKSVYRKRGTACAKACRDRIPDGAWVQVVFRFR